MEFETFYDNIKDVYGILILTIPHNLAQFAGFTVGEKVKVMIKKEG